MTKRFFIPLLCVLLLCGCAAQSPDVPDAPAATEPLPSLSGSDVFSEPIEEKGLLSYPLESPSLGILPMESGLLLFYEQDGDTLLTLVDPDSCEILHRYTASGILTPDNFTLQQLEGGLSWFDGQNHQTIVLDPSAREVLRIPAPSDLLGAPLLSSDRKTLYYCTSSAIRALDLDSGISRILKETAYPVQGLSGLLMEDSLLQFSITDHDGSQRTLFVSSQTGQLQGQWEGTVTMASTADSYGAILHSGSAQQFVFGSGEDAAMTLLPRQADAAYYPLPLHHRAVTVSQEPAGACLELYDLNTGRRTAALTLPGSVRPHHITEAADGSIWLLSRSEETLCDSLLYWDPEAHATADPICYTTRLYSRENPDYDGLAACSLYAQEIGEKYGIEVLIYKDAVAVQPWDYRLEYEYRTSVLQRELEALDARLGNYPPGFLQTLAEKFTALKICIIHSAHGTEAAETPQAVNGVQFWDGYDAYILLPTCFDTEYGLYHELCHLMETVVLTNSTAYDQWERLNPDGFQYSGSYSAHDPEAESWLQPGKEAFVDTYSMSYPKEDRARIMEYAMTDGHGELFRSPILQAKLLRLCTGIREAFGLEDSPERFLWEQYLSEPLASSE